MCRLSIDKEDIDDNCVNISPQLRMGLNKLEYPNILVSAAIDIVDLDNHIMHGISLCKRMCTPIGLHGLPFDFIESVDVT